MAYTRGAYAAESGSGRIAGAALIVALHALALAALWQLEPVRSAITAAPLLVSLIKPEPPKVAEPPKPIPPKPQPVKREPPQREPVRVTPAPAPILAAAPQAPAPQSVAVPPVAADPEPAPAPAVPAPPAPPPPPPPMTPPRFNADYLNNPAPAYPPLARRMGEEGRVVLRVQVNERGLPADVQLRTSSGSPRLDAAAIETVRQWKFVPARRGDTPVDAWVLVPISFSLRS